MCKREEGGSEVGGTPEGDADNDPNKSVVLHLTWKSESSTPARAFIG